jgi:hypothetical protein
MDTQVGDAPDDYNNSDYRYKCDNDGCDFFALTYADVENHEQGCFFGGFHFPAGASMPTARRRTLFTAPNRIRRAISSLAEKGMTGGFVPAAAGDLDADGGLSLASPQRRPRPDATTIDDATDASPDGWHYTWPDRLDYDGWHTAGQDHHLARVHPAGPNLNGPARIPSPDTQVVDDATDASPDGTTDAGLRQLAKRARAEAPRARSSHSARLAARAAAAEKAIPDTNGADGADGADGVDGADVADGADGENGADAFATLAAPAAAGADGADGANSVDGAA